MNLQEYIKEYYGNVDWWFVSEVCQRQHIDRINHIMDIKQYLDGERPRETTLTQIEGKWVKQTNIKLNFASILLDHNVSFLMKNPVTLICGDDEETLKQYQMVYKKGRFKRVDTKLYENMKMCGQAFEYLYFDEKENIQSKLLLPECSYPVYTDTGNYVCYINHYLTNNYIEYYTIYYPDIVEEYSSISGKVKFVSSSVNYSGLPISYRLPKKSNPLEGKSDVEDWKSIIDNMERLSSKYQDALYKFITGIPVMTGSKLSITKDGKGAISQDVIGYVLQLEEGSEFKFEQNKTDYQSMKLMHDTLFNYLLIASCVPAVSMNAQDVSNLSETSIRMMYQLAILKSGVDSQNLMDGFVIRWEQIRKMLESSKIIVNGEMDCEFQMEIPQNDQEVIDNLVKLRSISGISFDTMLGKNPYVNDVSGEKERIEKEEDTDSLNLDNVDTETDTTDTTSEVDTNATAIE
ncbi:phage portal protein [Clostridium estertheticum]|uniref:phage portal protein n=1 Tax=Clostridium estertheticum TaxID=238834 RepID=UPI00124EFD74|nr:phage portal protein [Clostridium estertheticum]MBZ9616795.1 phage portal protein [Clostridium estertheticum subsp. laramiense]WAG72502.1 phage portal protein [Clostridium estertheticum]